MVYLEKTWSLEVLFARFAWEESVVVEDQRRDAMRGTERALSKRFRRRLWLLPRLNPAALMARHATPGTVVDVGAGNGHYLTQLAEQFTPVGIEISSQAAALGQEKLRSRGGYFVNQDACSGLKALPAASASGVMMRSFLEHDSTPRETLQAAFQALKPGGILVLKVPNYGSWNRHIMGARWCGFRFPEHVNYFTPETLQRMVTAEGFSVRHFGPRLRLPTSDNMWMVAAK